MFTATYNNNNIIIINTQLTEKTVTVMSHCNFLKKNAWTVFRECLKLLTSSNCDWRQWCTAGGRIAEHQLLRNLCQQTQFVGGWVWICLASTENGWNSLLCYILEMASSTTASWQNKVELSFTHNYRQHSHTFILSVNFQIYDILDKLYYTIYGVIMLVQYVVHSKVHRLNKQSWQEHNMSSKLHVSKVKR